MNNPWTSLSRSAPYVLSSDVVALSKCSSREECRFDTTLLPEPFFGSVDAPVVVLNLNPGWNAGDAEIHAQREFAEMARSSLSHELKPYPFLHLQPSAHWPGAIWWRQRTHELVSEVGFDNVARGLGCIQFVAYHSRTYSTGTPRLPSQRYGYHLVEQAMIRGADIILMRSARAWLEAVPQLGEYSRLHRALNPRAPYISRGNLRSGFDAIVKRLQSES